MFVLDMFVADRSGTVLDFSSVVINTAFPPSKFIGQFDGHLQFDADCQSIRFMTSTFPFP